MILDVGWWWLHWHNMLNKYKWFFLAKSAHKIAARLQRQITFYLYNSLKQHIHIHTDIFWLFYHYFVSCRTSPRPAIHRVFLRLIPHHTTHQMDGNGNRRQAMNGGFHFWMGEYVYIRPLNKTFSLFMWMNEWLDFIQNISNENTESDGGKSKHLVGSCSQLPLFFAPAPFQPALPLSPSDGRPFSAWFLSRRPGWDSYRSTLYILVHVKYWLQQYLLFFNVKCSIHMYGVG